MNNFSLGIDLQNALGIWPNGFAQRLGQQITPCRPGSRHRPMRVCRRPTSVRQGVAIIDAHRPRQRASLITRSQLEISSGGIKHFFPRRGFRAVNSFPINTTSRASRLVQDRFARSPPGQHQGPGGSIRKQPPGSLDMDLRQTSSCQTGWPWNSVCVHRLAAISWRRTE